MIEEMGKEVKLAKKYNNELNNLFNTKKYELNDSILSIISNKEEVEQICYNFLNINNICNEILNYNNVVKIFFKGFIYKITFYENELSFKVYKDDIKIGHFYYWNKAKNGLTDLHIYFSDINSFKIMNVSDLTDEKFFMFLDAFKLFCENINIIFHMIQKEYNLLLKDIKTDLENNLSKEEKEFENLEQKIQNKISFYENFI